MFGEDKSKSKEKLERQILETLVLHSVKEQKLKRRWGIFFKLFFIVIIILIILFLFWPERFNPNHNPSKAHVAVVDVDGIISDDTDANSEAIIQGLKDAFDNDYSKAVVLKINSPGGSPVQSDEVFQAVRELEKKYPKKPLYAVCTDMCASGGYYIASAANDIYANPMSIVGSIGVRMDSFGFVEAMKKIGVTRRLFIAGKNKGFLDPFEPLNQNQVNAVNKMLDQTHQVFIDAVKEGRGKRLDLAQSNQLFSGEPFSGIEGKKLGLIDGFMSVNQLAYEKYKTQNIVNYSYKRNEIERILGRLSTQVVYKAMALSSGYQLRY